MTGDGSEDVSNAGSEDVSDAGSEDVPDAGSEDVSNAGSEDVSNAGSEDVSNAGSEDVPDDTGIELRAYDPDGDREALWALKRGFELELGAGTGDDDKADRYEGKLTDDYRERYLRWVERCVASDPYCVTVAEVVGDGASHAGGESGDADSRDADPNDVDSKEAADSSLAGYVFVLPWDLAMIWDAAVLNEIYVREPHRGTGVADALMESAVELARDQDPPLPRLVLDVDRGNDRARAFYERHGFAHWGEMVAREL